MVTISAFCIREKMLSSAYELVGSVNDGTDATQIFQLRHAMAEENFTQELERTILLYEDLIGHVAGRTRPMIARYGAIEALSRLMVSGDLQQGFKVLRDQNLLEHSFESLVVRFGHLFKKGIVHAAQWRLDHPHNLLL